MLLAIVYLLPTVDHEIIAIVSLVLFIQYGTANQETSSDIPTTE